LGRLLTQLGLTPVKSVAAEVKKPEPVPAGQQVGAEGDFDTIRTLKKDYRLIDTKAKLNKFLAELKKQSIFAVDTETTAVNPVRADLVGVSFFVGASSWLLYPCKGTSGSKNSLI